MTTESILPVEPRKLTRAERNAQRKPRNRRAATERARADLHAGILAERANGIDPKYLSAHARRRLSASSLSLAA